MDKKTIKAYKGFDKNLCCRGFQYGVGKTYELPKGKKVELCECGFHATPEDKSPLTVLEYYPPCYNGGQSRYCEVEIGGNIKNDDEKVVGSQIKIKAEIGIVGLVKAHIEWVRQHLTKESAPSATNTGYYSAATNTGYRSAATNTGDRSAATNTGYQSAATNTGDRSAATNTGYQSAATNTGYQSAAEVSGCDSIAAVYGCDSKARGAKGCALFLTERGEWNGTTCPIVNVKAVIVDGKKVKADTWYKLIDGKLVEVD